MADINPSHAVMVRADTSIADCVRRMKEQRVGSILVTHDVENRPPELIGIFTERDLLYKIDEIQHGGHWARPIRTVMTKPVFSLEVDAIDRAAEVMLARNIRHLPIVRTGSDGRKELLGIVSMRDLFKKSIEAKSVEPKKKSSFSIGIITDNSDELVSLSTGMFALTKVTLEKLSPGQELKRANLDALMIDLDKHRAEVWPALLKRINQTADLPLTIVLYDPMIHADKTIEVLKKIQATHRFAIFAKPVNLIQLMGVLNGSIA